MLLQQADQLRSIAFDMVAAEQIDLRADIVQHPCFETAKRREAIVDLLHGANMFRVAARASDFAKQARRRRNAVRVLRTLGSSRSPWERLNPARGERDKALEPNPDTAPIAIELDPGDALVFLGSTLHGAGGNRSFTIRRGAIISYCLGWLKPYENQWLAYPPETARHFPPELAALVGYRQHRPNLGNYEGRCPSILLHDKPSHPIGAIDALRPDQQALIEAHVAGQRTGG